MTREEKINELLRQDLPSLKGNKKLRDELVTYINELILEDFNKLVLLLYRVDVNEKKLKALLQENKDTDAAEIIADLLIKRQEEKLRTKEQFRQNDAIEDDEKW